MSGEAKDKGPTPAEVVAKLVEMGPEWLANALVHERMKCAVLVGQNNALEDVVLNRDLAEHEAVLTPETREFWRTQLLENRGQALAALAGLGKGGATATPADAGGAAAGAPAAGEKKPLHNRATARPVVPAGVGAVAVGGADDDADAKARSIRNRAHALAAAEKIPFATAWDRVAKEKV